MKISARVRPRAGFTLIEVVIALFLMAAIGGMVFGIARTSLRLGQAIVDKQAGEMEQHAFFDFLGRHVSSLPGNSRLEIIVEDDSGLYLSNLTLQNVPMSFNWGGQERLAKAVQLATVKRRNGLLDIVLRYYENEILEGSASDFGSVAEDEEPFAEIILLRDVARFEWRALNSTTMEWAYEWDDASRLPLQLELMMAMGARGATKRHVFWIPPRQNPELIMRQMAVPESSQSGGVEPPPIGVSVPGVGLPNISPPVDGGNTGGGQ